MNRIIHMASINQQQEYTTKETEQWKILTIHKIMM